MSDEEEQYEEEEAEAEEAPKQKQKERRPEPEDSGKEKTEGELAMLAQKRKQEEEDETKLAQYEEQRRIQREKEEEELRLLKEKQERRKAEREEEERIMAERKREEEERRRQEEEERRAKKEAENKKKEEEKRRRQELLMAGMQMGGIEIQKKDKTQEKFDKFGGIVKAKAEMGFTKEQQEDHKRRQLAEIIKPIDFSDMDAPTLKSKIKELHTRLCRLEGDKYDLEQRSTRQKYDLKELNERQRQITRARAMKKGLNPEDAAGPHPPKVPVVSKYDRQIDRRNFRERRAIYDAPKTYPHFPNVPPMPQELLKEIKGEKQTKKLDEDGNEIDGGGDGEEVEAEEEEEEEEE